MLYDYNEIIPGRLWVGSFLCPQDAKQLRRLGITTVISLQSDRDLKSRGVSLKKLLKSLDEADVDFLRMPVHDFNEEDIARQLAGCISELEAALAPGWAKVYLHCTAGMNRSPTVAAAYLMKSHGWPARQAYDYLIEKRNCSPYLNVLEMYESVMVSGYRLKVEHLEPVTPIR